jgi:excisionase family DNA binding protein
MEAIIEKTTKKDQQIAKASITQVHLASKKISDDRSNVVTINIPGRSEPLEIPTKALFLLFDILDNMADGKSFALIQPDNEVSTQQAADLLRVSRPHIIKLLEKGIIPFSKTGTHRRILLKDIVEYDKKQKKNRADNLDLLAKQAQELNMGY